MSLVPPKSPGRTVPARRKGQLAESRREKVMAAGMRARPSCLITSQRLLRCASAHSTGDPAGVYPRLSKSRISSSSCLSVPQPRPLLPLSPHTSVWRLREKDNIADLGRGVAFSSGDAGPLHSILPHPLADTLPTLSLAGLDGKTWVLQHL